MAAFMDISNEEQLKELATFAASLVKDTKPNLESECNKLVEAGNLQQALSTLVGACDSFIALEKGCESVCNSLVTLACGIKVDSALVQQLAEAIADPSQQANGEQRLRVLSNFYNQISGTSIDRFHVYKQILKLAAATEQHHAVAKQLDNLHTWMATWGCSVDQTRDMYRLLFSIFEKRPRGHRFLTKLLSTFNGAAKAELDSVREDAEKLIAHALAQRLDFQVFLLANLDAVKNLAGSPLADAFDAFLSGDYSKYSKAAPGAKAVFDKFGFDAANANHRARLMALANKCAGVEALSFAEIAAAIQVDEADVESWIIDVVRAGFVEAKVNGLEN
jgi:translation initiation factor 3 subunit M